MQLKFFRICKNFKQHISSPSSIHEVSTELVIFMAFYRDLPPNSPPKGINQEKAWSR